MEQATLVSANPATGNPSATPGTSGLNTQIGNQPATVSGAAAATGGVDAGNLIDRDIDEDLFQFNSDDTPIMNLMLKAKKITVKSSEVEHYSIDEPTAMVKVASVNNNKITLNDADKMKLHSYDTLIVPKVMGYMYVNGSNVQDTKPLMLFVTSIDDDGVANVKALNGVKTSATDEYGNIPSATSPATDNTNYLVEGTTMILLGNALYETQKFVDPDMVLPQPEIMYLQKRGMNSIVSDYFDSQKKRIPFSKAVIAEAEIRNFKVKGNRTLLMSLPSKFRVKSRGMGDMQYVYTTRGIRWQFKREVEHTGRWTYEDFIGLAKLFFTGEDVPSTCIALCGKNFLENIQSIDWSTHPEVKIEVKTNQTMGWKVTVITTVFGDIQFKREPTFDRVGYENCCALLGENRLVHYQRKAETQFTEKVEGEEATRQGILVFDALALKGRCHIWVDGNGEGTAPGATEFVIWNSTTAPTASNAKNGAVYYFTQETVLSQTVTANEGDMYMATVSGSTITWSEYHGMVSAA